MSAWVETAIATLVLVAVPACVWRLRVFGIFVGAVVGWSIGVVADRVIANPDPEAGPIAGLWLRYGWVVTVTYAVLLFAVMWFLRKLSRNPLSS